MRTTLFVLAISSLAFTACAQSGNPSNETATEIEPVEQQDETVVKSVDVEAFASMMEENPGVLVDVRTPEEYSAGHLEGAELINFYGSDFEAKVSELDRDVPVYVYCRSGGRSGRSAGQLHDMGFKTVIDLSGGIMAWEAQGKETVK